MTIGTRLNCDTYIPKLISANTVLLLNYLLYITDAIYYIGMQMQEFPKLTRDRVWGTNLYKVSTNKQEIGR